MTKKTGNPYINPPNYFEGYDENIENLKNQPELVSFDKLCYEVFEMTEAGKKLMAVIEERFLLPSLAQMNNNYQISCIHAEGLKDGFRMLRQAVASHKQRIKAEVNQ